MGGAPWSVPAAVYELGSRKQHTLTSPSCGGCKAKVTALAEVVHSPSCGGCKAKVTVLAEVVHGWQLLAVPSRGRRGLLPGALHKAMNPFGEGFPLATVTSHECHLPTPAPGRGLGCHELRGHNHAVDSKEQHLCKETQLGVQYLQGECSSSLGVFRNSQEGATGTPPQHT